MKGFRDAVFEDLLLRTSRERAVIEIPRESGGNFGRFSLVVLGFLMVSGGTVTNSALLATFRKN